MRTYKILPGCDVDAFYVSEHLRRKDAEELYLFTGKDPAFCAKYSWVVTPSYLRWVVYVDDEPAGIFGCKPKMLLVREQAVPWFLGTPAMAKIKVAFCKNTIKYINKMLEYYDYLENYVLTDYQESIRWMRWAGFTEGEVLAMGPFHANFTRFYIYKDRYKRRI